MLGAVVGRSMLGEMVEGVGVGRPISPSAIFQVTYLPKIKTPLCTSYTYYSIGEAIFQVTYLPKIKNPLSCT